MLGITKAQHWLSVSQSRPAIENIEEKSQKRKRRKNTWQLKKNLRGW